MISQFHFYFTVLSHPWLETALLAQCDVISYESQVTRLIKSAVYKIENPGPTIHPFFNIKYVSETDQN